MIKKIDIELVKKIFLVNDKSSRSEVKISGSNNDAYQPDSDYIFNFNGKIKVNKEFQKLNFSYINNPDGTIRWIYPSGLRMPHYLGFYNSSGILSILYVFVSLLLFRMKMGFILRSGTFSIHYKKELPLLKNVLSNKQDELSIFTGTTGPNRKALVALINNDKIKSFIKIPIGMNSDDLIQNEFDMLNKLNDQTYKHIKLPKVEMKGKMLLQENIKTDSGYSTTLLGNHHFKAIGELYKRSNQITRLSDLPLFNEIHRNIESINPYISIPHYKNLYTNLKILYNSLNANKEIHVATGHMDFTPWNMYLDNNKLYMYDWEMAGSDIPVLFDIFHFVFQSGILIERKSFDQINDDLIKITNYDEFKTLSKLYKVDVDIHLKLYLTYIISYYMVVYQDQKKLHKQVFWLLNVWNKALEAHVVHLKTISSRTKFIHQFITFLSGKQYAVLKNTETVYNLNESSDIDILINKNDIEAIKSFVNQIDTVEKVRYTTKSFMTIVEMYFIDGSFISIDLIHKFKRKNIVYLNPAEILNNTVFDSNMVLVPGIQYNFEYTMLFYILNGSDIPSKYQSYYNTISITSQKVIINYLNSRYDLGIIDLCEVYSFTEELRELIEVVVNRLPENKRIMRIINIVSYLKDTVKQILSGKGRVITFSGVDGAGKSTVIEELANNLRTVHRSKVVVLRHRPSLLPILSSIRHGKRKAEKLAGSTLPRKGKNKSMLLSYIRFGYYYTDYLVGQLYIYLRYILRNYIVIYDRYYFDFINDSVRSNIVIHRSIARALYRFIHKPTLNFFLYAEPDIILQRKRELNENDIKELTIKYKDLFNELSVKYNKSRYKVIENIKIDNTLNIINHEYKKAI